MNGVERRVEGDRPSVVILVCLRKSGTGLEHQEQAQMPWSKSLLGDQP